MKQKNSMNKKKTHISLTLDSRNRICLSALLPEGLRITSFIAHQEDDKIILEPMAEIPAREAWLYQNPKALGMVLEGLKQAEEGKVHDLKIDYRQFLDD